MFHQNLLHLINEVHLHEGGAAGHLRHLSDNHDLTFGEIKDVLSNAADGRLERASEKLDGINLVFTWAARDNVLRVARSGGDIKGGGMDAAALAKKFFGRGNIEQAFNSAFKVLNDALGSLGKNEKQRVFGENGSRWYSMEIVYAAEPNVINYDSNNIVFHEWPVFDVTETGKVEETDDASGVSVLARRIDSMQKSVSMKDWQVRGPSLVSLRKISDGSALATAIGKIDAAMAQANVGDDDTVYDYLKRMMTDDVSDLELDERASAAVVERASGIEGAMHVNDLKKLVPKDKQKLVQDFIKVSPELKRRYVEPIESAIQNFTIEVLRGVESTLIAQSDKEVSRLKAQVEKAINAIKSSGNEAAMDVLQKEMLRLRSVDNVSAAMEGIVFFYKGKAYKFTGAFAPAHTILSLFKYGRKGIPKMDLGEVVLRQSLKNLLNEGGHAFKDVVPISLENFNKLWPEIKADLDVLGIQNIETVGSTGKKQIMGDIDVAGTYDGTREELFDSAREMFGQTNVVKSGASQISVRYEYEDQAFQVDVMFGNMNYLRWSKYGTSPEKDHAEYSPVKGAVRNVLLNVINRFASHKVFPGMQNELDRTRYSVDFDKGLFKVVQTKRNKTPGKPPTKQWKTVSRELISDDPDQIVATMFGKGYNASDLNTFEQTIDALKTSPNLSDIADQILSKFASEMREFEGHDSKMLGDDPETTLAYIDRIAGIRKDESINWEDELLNTIDYMIAEML